ncbi:MAG: hypothetical protein A2836_01495 [Candidatus Taylorbacteria bacterium RIFCSPHIGHO2_01_FULL_45_63]|uniref:Uncharacterized protein n=1 Tax=Candidatus Taylorbacteria bacterium RIFCSPHIGHO2_02_FULL_45_35 TaxID=1802311 RepID=A0A1G2MWC3_9BACT|nr:MAG: hypothetical protein A2836_01495 [Candidatus Taylorbacteria bacterium RIFCSPHIGHO2_01_FULL_45_63]OHA28084.1 MAG: hypothetical protein A3D56_00195 [Candidatus Taylorbacteria bacterium RIFCSPHIGHO2_02_FULL_45_35]OHA34910.1 MAG: hypothetical protein A3A22_02995 [Candidatus Taylorbacteria bacterium RIFCSPLOWO2_01_FULL_45_34b]
MKSEEWFKEMHAVVEGEKTAEEVVRKEKDNLKPKIKTKQEIPLDHRREWERKQEEVSEKRGEKGNY